MRHPMRWLMPIIAAMFLLASVASAGEAAPAVGAAEGEEAAEPPLQARALPRPMRVTLQNDAVVEGTVLMSGPLGVVLVNLEGREAFVSRSRIRSIEEATPSGPRETVGVGALVQTYEIEARQGIYEIQREARPAPPEQAEAEAAAADGPAAP